MRILKYVSILVIGLFFMGAGCGNYGDDDSQGATQGDTYQVSGENNKVFILNADGSRECYDLDANGSLCAQDFIVNITTVEEHYVGDGHTDPSCPHAAENLEAIENF